MVQAVQTHPHCALTASVRARPGFGHKAGDVADKPRDTKSSTFVGSSVGLPAAMGGSTSGLKKKKMTAYMAPHSVGRQFGLGSAERFF